ncbi:hypothetical protein I302_100637 [Kwoniella bestiolae CBS 10118]|uniref:RNA polymerase II elongation factor ELL N-terminal domain-containing protein n=1 Tax=Kwoniella bestiolae CBS 10118 TaxID=1296100 RepID=A0A1B9G5Q2_9TREE|nr:hypothetical protein I302_04011 [Kwoniella bestiolae CBS 10118]OCF26328.1 hypothetical protein I302_04011 [Kwoniella bestiolae CBS 10118]
MPLPTSGSIPLTPPNTEHPPNPAYLIKFPEEVWQSLQEAGSGGLEVSVTADGKMTLNIPNLPPIPLDPRSTGIPSELHLYNPSSSTLSLAAMASTRLNVPLTSASTARAADKLKAQSEAIERERKERAIRVEGSVPPSKKRLAPSVSSAGMGRANSSPQMGSAVPSPAPAPASVAGSSGTGTGTGQMIPLKTRVMQLLALGPTTVQDIVRRVGGDEQNVMRVVKVVGRASSTHPPTYTLLPNQYSKIKLGPGQWKYTYAEQQQVIRLAREAFDELELPFDAEEREELDRKEAELENGGGGYHSASAESSNGSQEKPTAAVPQNGLSIAPPVSSAPSRNESPAPSTSSTTKAKSTRKSTTGSGAGGSGSTGPQSRIARERAKFMLEKQRSTSLPNTKPPDGTASPRATPLEIKPKDREKNEVTKVDGMAKSGVKGKEKGKGKEIDYSSDDEDESPPRGRSTNGKDKEKKDTSEQIQQKGKERLSLAEKVREKDKARALEQQQKEKERLTPNHKKRNYSSSPEPGEEHEEGEIRGRPTTKIRRNSSPTSKRKPPPPELKLNGSSSAAGSSKSTMTSTPASANIDHHPVSAPLPRTNGISQIDRPDQESLRDRYEELYPAYQQLTKKLSRIHQAAESGMKVDGDAGTDEVELNRLVGKWQKWHNELEGIRRWFV